MKALGYVIGWTVLTVLLAGIATLSVLSCSRKSVETCGDLEVSFTDSLRFLTAEDIKDIVAKNYGVYAGQRRDSVKLSEIEDILESESSVKECEAWISRDGNLHIEISQRIPSVMFNNNGVRFYADKDGYIFPLHGKKVDVPVISGELPLSESASYRGLAAKPEEKVWVENVLKLIEYIGSNRRWRGQVTEFKADKGWNLILRTGLGKERIILGYPEEFEQKFKKLEDYYSTIVPRKGIDYYKSVDLKYNNQIICRKDI